jgi:cytochrome b
VVKHFQGDVSKAPHTAPGIWLALGIFSLVALQAFSGLGTSDDIFTEGPLFKHLPEQLSDRFSWVHHRAFWAIFGLICIHLLAHAVYAIRKDPAPLAMFSGRKHRALASTPSFLLRGLVTALACAGVVYYTLELL